ncbi:uncharacterized protein LOC114724718 isoform X3 [Neltuma alba]|uniref:uncharacterized protein LOC114724718 isoform X3 n=1 Tax=Neltuma alba TaxID=207710 RepID=UPI0010A440A6|nr:uncharacterized protein LOC114724718 isoform X3 [Prosopis alba]
MYLRRIQCRDWRWGVSLQPLKYLIRPRRYGHACFQSLCPKTTVEECVSHDIIVKRRLLESFLSRVGSSNRSCTDLNRRPSSYLRSTQLRFYSSESDGRNASEGNHVNANDGARCDKQKNWQDKFGEDAKLCNAHAQLGKHDQEEWLKNEKIAIENKKRESPFLTRKDKFKNEFLRRVVPWEKINISWDTFPYYIHENTKNLLLECAASHLRHNKVASSYGTRLSSSSGRILLQSVPGTELYRERLVRALAQDLKVPLLVLDSNILAPYYIDDDISSSECESDDDNAESGEEASLESENEDDNNEEEWTSSAEAKSDASDNEEHDAIATAEAALKKRSSEESENSESTKSEVVKPSDPSGCQLKKGDRVKYIGPSVQMKVNNSRIILGKIMTSDGPTNAYTNIHGRSLSNGQRGEVYEVEGDQAAVIMDISEDDTKEGELEKSNEHTDSRLCWIHVKDIEHDPDAQVQDCYIAMEALCEVLDSKQPLIVYFPDSTQWFHKSILKSNRKEFFRKVQEMFDKLSGPVVLICGQNKIQSGSKEKKQFTMILPNFGRVGKLPLSLKHLTEGLGATKRSDDDELHKLFTNVLCIHPPKEDDQLGTFKKQLEEDRKIVISRSSLNELHKVLEEHELSCLDLLQVNTDGVILTKQKAEKVVGWAKNNYLSSCPLPYVKGERLCLPRESLEIAISRLRDQETMSRKPSQGLKNLAKDEYESNFISAVVPPGEIGVQFDDIGALEDVKMALNELVILPMRRPELFSRGNLLRPCKGILLFGPPGTGKTLLAKALATEAGANFISITGSTLTSKWFGDAEKLTKALFSFASKLAPVIIFVDEVDSLLGARGGAFEHEATRRMRNEFMAAWDGLRTKESQRILILGATNRPFDLDDAVIRRLPRRIYVDLPDAENRMKILRIFLAQENLDHDFHFDKLANLTEGYSGSDLKNLCIAAAYRPVQELLENEKKASSSGPTSVLRPLKLDDFIQAKSKVGPSVAYDAASMNELRKWNEMYGEGGSRTKSPFGF